MQSTKAFPWKSFLKKVVVIAVPVALQNLLTTTGSMIDTMMLAPLGKLTVGAVGLWRAVFIADVFGLLGLRRRRNAVFLAVFRRKG